MSAKRDFAAPDMASHVPTIPSAKRLSRGTEHKSIGEDIRKTRQAGEDKTHFATKIRGHASTARTTRGAFASREMTRARVARRQSSRSRMKRNFGAATRIGHAIVPRSFFAFAARRVFTARRRIENIDSRRAQRLRGIFAVSKSGAHKTSRRKRPACLNCLARKTRTSRPAVQNRISAAPTFARRQVRLINADQPQKKAVEEVHFMRASAQVFHFRSSFRPNETEILRVPANASNGASV